MKQMDRKIAPEALSKEEFDSVVISVDEISATPPNNIYKNEEQEEQHGNKQWRQGALFLMSYVLSLLSWRQMKDGEIKRVAHSFKVGLALVLVSLLYMLEAVHDKLGDNAMWAVMTVVVVFEFTSGATISKGLNRGAGTILGCGLGSLVALLSQEIGGTGKAVAIGSSVFIFVAAATYFRLAPKIKKKYDYGALIFILTFSLVSVSGVRGDQIIILSRDRLSSIMIGFAICLFISIFVSPVWAGDELHNSLSNKFDKLAESVEGCMEDYTCLLEGKKGTQSIRERIRSNCLSVLSSKSSDEALANFATWEPWHGRFGFYYPWKKYLQIGDSLRELAAYVLSLTGCLQSINQPPQEFLLNGVKERCESTCKLMGSTLREIGKNIKNMTSHGQRDIMLVKLENLRLELCSSTLQSSIEMLVNQSGAIEGGTSFTSSVFLLGEIIGKVEVLIKEIQDFEKLANFPQK
ncbi:Aluminum-activated malate transporter protein [Dioscorea alata]|uniref:Aluminum-activated malate transporter protein n=1 Tax=Dioscorea alata TaxID=55571 RepID=A0ACB7VY21_DIOAL|nr:Aluminum-activated malate transporter protein [Dioscorea alata]